MRSAALILLLTACAGPHRLIADAEDRLNDADRAIAAGDYTRALSLQRDAVALAERLPAAYPESAEAGAVASGTLTLGEHSLRALRDRVIPTSEVRVAALTDLAAAAAYLGVASRDDVTLASVARGLARGAPRAALVTARWIVDPSARAKALLAVAEGARASLAPEQVTKVVDAAADAAREVDSVVERWDLLEAVSAAYLPQQRFDRAVAIARGVPEPTIRVRALIAAGDALAEAGRGEEASTVLSEALDAANVLDEPGEQAPAWVRLARIYAEGGAADGARTLLKRTAGALGGLPLEQAEPILAQAAAAWASLGDVTQALNAMRGIGTEAGRARAFTALAHAASQPGGLAPAVEAARHLRGDEAGAAQTALLIRLGEAAPPEVILAAAPHVTDPADRARALAVIGQRRRDLSLLEAARAAAGDVYEDTERAAARTRVALALAAVGALDPANQLLEEATAQALGAPSPAARAAGLTAIAQAALEAGQIGAAVPRLEAALQQGDAVQDALARVGLLTDAAALAARPPAPEGKVITLNPDLVQRALAVAILRAAALTYEGPRATALGRLANLLPALGARAGDPARAMLEAAGALEDPDRRAALSRRALVALAASGEAERALEGAAQDPATLVEVAAAAAADVPTALRAVEAIGDRPLQARALADLASAAPGPPPAEARPALVRLIAAATTPAR